MAEPIARGPIRPMPPTSVISGWLVSTRRSSAALRLADLTPMTKVMVRSDSPVLDVGFGRAARAGGTLMVGSGPGEWMLLSAPGTAEGAAFRVARTGFTSVIDLTHGRALMRLSGADSHRLLAKLCSIDLADHMAPNGAAFRATIAKLVTDIIRDDIDSTPSYLLHCETSSGQYLFDTLLDAGDEYGIDVDGFGVDPGLTLPDEDVRSLRLAD